MKPESPWKIVRAGNEQMAIRMFEDAFAQDPSGSRTMELGLGYLWFKRYDAAWHHFREGLRRPPGTSALYFQMAGVAKWCSGERQLASEEWRRGLTAQYADAAGGIGN